MDTIREMPCDRIADTARDLFIRAGTDLGDDVLSARLMAAQSEDTPLGKYPLEKIIRKAAVAKDESPP